MYTVAELAILLKTKYSRVYDLIIKHNIQSTSVNRFKLYSYDELLTAFRQGIE